MSRRETLLVVTEDGYGKRVPISEMPRVRRGAKGVAAVAKPSQIKVAAALVVTAADQLLIATRRGKFELIAASEIPVYHRRSHGVRIIALQDGDRIAGVESIPAELAR